jgi:glycosidase
LTQRLPRIAALGATVLWLSPVTGAPPGDFGYAVTDEMHVRPVLGTEADLRDLVRTSHALGLHVILDMVVNHLSDRHPYAVDARRRGAASPYYDWFERDARGRVMHYFDWTHLDNLNYADPAVRRFVIAASAHWVRDIGVDGYRVDASWAVRERAPGFWPQWRAALDRIDPGLLLLAEGSATDPYFLAHGFNADYDWTSRIGEWAWRSVFDRSAAASGAGSGREPRGRTGSRAALPETAPDLARLRAALLDTSSPGRVLRFLDDNDSGPRFITRHGLAETKLAATMLLTLPGLPLIYDGDEVGAEFEPYDGRPIVRRDRYGLRALYARLGGLRRTTPALRTGAIRLVATDHDDTVLAYVRPGPRARPEAAALVAINWADTEADVKLEPDDDVRRLAANGAACDLLNGGTVRLTRAHAAKQRPDAWRLRVPPRTALVLSRSPQRLEGRARSACRISPARRVR